jgi:hypothetical protein
MLKTHSIELSKRCSLWVPVRWVSLGVSSVNCWLICVWSKNIFGPRKRREDVGYIQQRAGSSVKPKLLQEILKDFVSHSTNAFSISFGDATSLVDFRLLAESWRWRWRCVAVWRCRCGRWIFNPKKIKIKMLILIK